MIDTLQRIARICIVLGASITPGLVRAQDSDPAGKLYGRGVNAYFAGRLGEADSALSRALESNPQDPRAYYFRALARLHSGRTVEARDDMIAGAALEARLPNRFGIGAVLQRVQGSDRLLLEQYRRKGQSTGVHGDAQSAPINQLADQDAVVLRQRIVIPLDELLRPGGPRPVRADIVQLPPSTVSRAGNVTPPGADVGHAAAPAAVSDPFRDDVPAAEPQTAPPASLPPAVEKPADSAPQSEAPPQAVPETEENPFEDL